MMISPLYSSISGITAAAKTQSTSAHNVANSNTDGFKSLVASAEEHENGGVRVSISENPEQGALYNKGDGELVESSNVDHAREAVNQMSSANMLAANVASLKSYEEMSASVIDMMA